MNHELIKRGNSFLLLFLDREEENRFISLDVTVTFLSKEHIFYVIPTTVLQGSCPPIYVLKTIEISRSANCSFYINF